MRWSQVPGTFGMMLFALCLTACGQVPTADKSGLRAEFAPDGQMTVRLDGKAILQGPAAAGAPRVRFRQASETIGLFGYRGEDAKVNTKLTETTFDAASRTAVQKFAWGKVAWNYDIAGDRLDLTITVTNDTDKVLYAFSTDLFSLTVPEGSRPARVSEATFFGQTVRAMRMEVLSGPLVLPLIVGDRSIVACSPEAVRPLQLRWSGPPRSRKPKARQGKHNDPAAQALAEQEARRSGADAPPPSVNWTLSLQAGGDQLVWHGRYTSRPIAPGKSDTYVVSLRIGSADAPLAAAADVCKAYAKAHPMLLKWDDRRPILRTFIGDWFPHHPPVDLQGSKPKDVPPPDKFREKVLRSADRLIENMKLADAQGMVIWNVEGSTVPRIKYVGDPQSVETMCPEMDAIADEYFGRIRKAGFRTGLCIRPTTLVAFKGKDGKLHWRHSYPPDDNPVDALTRKIKYAKGRWGCTLFYIDTNSNVRMPRTDAEKAWWPKRPDGRFLPYRELMSAEQWQEIYRRYPDVLLIPEHSYLLCYTVAAAYDQMNMGSIAGAGATPAVVLATWPKAFKCLTADVPLTKYFDRTVRAFAQGDVVMTNSPVKDGGRPLLAARSAGEYARVGPPKDLAALPADKLLAIATDANAEGRRRYFAAARVLAPAESPPAIAALEALLATDDWLVRKLALDAVGGEAHAKMIGPLLAIASDSRSSLRLAAAEAVGRIGPAALPQLRTVAYGKDRGAPAAAVRAMNAMIAPEATEAMLAILGDPQAPQSARAVTAQMLARNPRGKQQEVVTGLLGLLDDKRLRTNAASGLRGLKDKRIVPALTAALKAEQAKEKPDARFVSALQRALRQRR